VARDDCSEGWYAVVPRGFVCLDPQSTLDPRHPTLQARELRADRNASLPYPYATSRRSLTLFEPDPEHRDGVRERGRLGKGSTFAVVGSWDTLDEYDQRQRLAMLTLGAFVPTRSIEPIRPVGSDGVALDGAKHRLPVGFPISSKAQTYRFAGIRPVPFGVLDEQGPIGLTSKTRYYDGERYFLLAEDSYVAEHDVAVARQRNEFPDFVSTSTHWVDIDVAQGILVLYAGETPTYVMRSRGRPSESVQRGTGWVGMKQITDLTSTKPASEKTSSDLDHPWVITLDTGVTLRASLEVAGDTSKGPGQGIELNPADASRLFRFLLPEVPEGWHAVAATDPRRESSAVVVR
jgi:hypothetical protein